MLLHLNEFPLEAHRALDKSTLYNTLALHGESTLSSQVLSDYLWHKTAVDLSYTNIEEYYTALRFLGLSAEKIQNARQKNIEICKYFAIDESIVANIPLRDVMLQVAAGCAHERRNGNPFNGNYDDLTEDEDEVSTGGNVEVSHKSISIPAMINEELSIGENLSAPTYHHHYTGRSIHETFKLSIFSSEREYDVYTSSLDGQQFDNFETFKTYWDGRSADNESRPTTYCAMDHSDYRSATIMMDEAHNLEDDSESTIKVVVESAFMAKELHGSALMYASFLAVWFNHIEVLLDEIYATVVAIRCAPKVPTCANGSMLSQDQSLYSPNSDLPDIKEEDTIKDLYEIQVAEGGSDHVADHHYCGVPNVSKLTPQDHISYKVNFIRLCSTEHKMNCGDDPEPSRGGSSTVTCLGSGEYRR